MDEKLEKLKKLLKEKFKEILDPENNDYVFIIKEELVDEETDKINYEIGIGKVMKFPAKVSVNGKTYRNEELDEVKEGSVILIVKDITKRDARHKLLLVRVPKPFYRSVDEASWANSFKTLDDIIRVVENFKV